ncbi:MAG: hypothetical protein ABIO93_03310 [Dyadobacter sp.]|uniref:hypothetical protein n=1 Tax=Dyadobacter sp. TaxID=1914288 RepID=UPI003263D008
MEALKTLYKKEPDLQAILSYQDENIISRFVDSFDVTWEQAEDVFQETKKFLVMGRLPGVFMFDDILILDEMWHNFICFTREYAAFGEAYFGEFLHHLPNTKAEKESVKELAAQNPEKAQQSYLESLKVTMEYCYDAFGEETVTKWFQVYPIMYSKENIKLLRKH